MMLTDLFRGNLLALEVRALMIAAACMSLAGCPGRSSSPQVQQPPVVVQPSPPVPEPSAPPADDAQAPAVAQRRREKLATKEFGFFWSDVDEMRETLGWVTFKHIPKMGEYGRNLCKAAIQAGHKRLIITLDDAGFVASTGRRVYRGSINSRISLREFLTLLVADDLLQYVIGAYTADEANLDGARISDGDMLDFCADARAVFAEFGISVPLWTIYGGANGDRPGIAGHDRIGVDDYGRGLDAINGYPELRPWQKLFFVPACAKSPNGDRSPWQEHPAGWVDAMIDDDRCVGIVAFAWSTEQASDGSAGLRYGSAELRQAWIDAGYEIVAARDAS